MKKSILILSCITLLFSCGGNKQEGEASRERDSLLNVVNQRESELSDIMSVIDEIQVGFQNINVAEGRVDMARTDDDQKSSVAKIKEDMSYIGETMEKNRQLIEELNKKLQNSSIANDKIRKTVANLQAELVTRQEQIDQLKSELESKNIVIADQERTITDLSGNVSDLKEVNDEQSKIVSAQEQELNTGWFVFGTKSELREQKILVDGDVLRSSDFNKNYFTKVDIRNFGEVKLYSKSAKLLTDHPANSYSLTKDSKGQYVLHILKPKEFWSTSKYLVIQVK